MATQRTVELLKKSAVATTLAAEIENNLGKIIWYPIGDFGTEFTINDRNQVGFDVATKTYWAWLGELPHAVLSTDEPNTNDWKNVTQETLSALLNNPAESANRVARMVIDVGSIKDLGNVPKIDGRQYSVKAFYDGWAALKDAPVGGGIFYWDASRDKAEHNGGTVIDPDRIDAWDGTQGDLATLFTAGSGNGCYVRVFDGEVDPCWFGLTPGAEDSTLELDKALSLGLNVRCPEGVINIKGGQIYIRESQTLTGAGIDKTIIRLKDNAGSDRLSVVEMDSYSFIDELTIDGNWENNSSDKNLWLSHEDVPFAQGLYMGRFQTNGNSLKPTNGMGFGRIKIKEVIRSGIVTGNDCHGEFAEIENCYTDHHLYYSGGKKSHFKFVICRGFVDGDSVVFSTNSNTYSEGNRIDNLVIQDLRKSDYPGARQPSCITCRSLINRDSVSCNSIGYLEINDYSVDSEINKPRVIAAQHNQSLNIEVLRIQLRIFGGENLLFADHGHIHVDTFVGKITGGEITTTTSVVNSSSSNPNFRSLVCIGDFSLDCDAISGTEATRGTQIRAVTCASADVFISQMKSKTDGGMLFRLAGGLHKANIFIGNLDATGFVREMQATSGDNPGAFNLGSKRIRNSFVTPGALSYQEMIGASNFIKLDRETNVISRFIDVPDGFEFFIVGDGTTTINDNSSIRTLGGQHMPTEEGKVYKFVYIDGAAWQIM